MNAAPSLPATRPCPGDCGSRIMLAAPCCSPCMEKLSPELRDHYRQTRTGTHAHQQARVAIRYYLEELAPKRDIAAERRQPRQTLDDRIARFSAGGFR